MADIIVTDLSPTVTVTDVTTGSTITVSDPGAQGGITVGTGIITITVASHTELQDIGTNTHDQIDAHIADTANPHGVTFEQLPDTPTYAGNAGKVLKINATATGVDFDDSAYSYTFTQETQPLVANQGDSWLNTTTGTYSIYNGSVWVRQTLDGESF